MASKLFAIAAIWLNIFYILKDFQVLCLEPLKFDELSTIELTSRLKNSIFEGVPFCVVFKRSPEETQIEKKVIQFYNELEDESPYRQWSFSTINLKMNTVPPTIHPGFSPTLQCHIGESSPLQYREVKSSTKSIRKWFKAVSKAFKKRIVPVTLKDISSVISDHYGITVIGVPGYFFHAFVEELLKQVKKDWKGAVSVAMVPPSSDDESDFCQKYGVHEFPAVLLFDKQEWDENQKPVVVLQGQLNTGADQLKLELTIRESQVTVLNLANFKKEAMDTDVPMSPVAVTFYSHNNPRSLVYMDTVRKTIDVFATIDSSFRFGVVNLVTSREVVGRYVNASLAASVPFTVVFWQEKHQSDSKYVTKQALLHTGIPTVDNLYNFVMANNVPLVVDEDVDMTWLNKQELICGTTEPSDGNQCGDFSNTTVDSLLLSTEVYGPDLASPGWQDIKIVPSTNESTDTIPHVTDKTWASTIEQSVQPVKSYGPAGVNNQHSKSYRVSLVVFIKSGCGYCTKVVPVLQEIAKMSKMIGVSLYMMNCSSDPVHCNQHGITGYPTLTAFRSLSWSLVEDCFPTGQRSHYIRVDYHGAIVPNLVLDWLSNINIPAVNKKYMDDHLPDNLDNDVYLVAKLYTRALARQYLSARLVDRWYSYQCYTLVCELLYGLVPCYAIYTRDVVDHVGGGRNDKELVVSKLSLYRKDGVRASIFELGYNLVFTLNQDSDSRLHMFHKPHRYNVADDFKCEDDHRLCTGYIVQFARDHRRLPVTQITTAIFHTKTGLEDTSDAFTKDLPVMLILVHSQNISRDNHFYKELTMAAYSMYQDMVFATVNVDEFSYWASNFVPKNYHNKYAYDTSMSPSFYHYPRLCIVRWQDHQHAAFYPSVNEMERLGTRVQERLDKIDSQQIIKFAQDFLKDPEKLVVRTEMF